MITAMERRHAHVKHDHLFMSLCRCANQEVDSTATVIFGVHLGLNIFGLENVYRNITFRSAARTRTFQVLC